MASDEHQAEVNAEGEDRPAIAIAAPLLPVVAKRLPFNLTIPEWEVLTAQARVEQTALINVTRRALRYYLTHAHAQELPPTLFADRRPGNRQPKPKGKGIRGGRVARQAKIKGSSDNNDGNKS